MQSEDDYRLLVWRRMLEAGGYRPEQLALNFPVVIAAKTYRADIAVFPTPHHRGQNAVSMVVECKRGPLTHAKFEKAWLQLQTYVIGCPNALWGVLFCGQASTLYERRGNELVMAPEQLIPTAETVALAAERAASQKFGPVNAPLTSRLHEFIRPEQERGGVVGAVERLRASSPVVPTASPKSPRRPGESATAYAVRQMQEQEEQRRRNGR